MAENLQNEKANNNSPTYKNRIFSVFYCQFITTMLISKGDV
ncbi:hypothetical protein MHA_1009 [Mannheimia haemolytica PHL213]|nr:hypothetical protein MHH_c08600 [Mannheimia haemolytica M42548]EDN73954.1 hypothetical protein MHA_1009 [Mannheimia haemolytica PHL213]